MAIAPEPLDGPPVPTLTEPAGARRGASFGRDLASAYAASLARVASWVIVSALVFRRSTEAFALLALVRGTIGVLNYASLGLLPAMIRMLALIPSPPGVPGGEGQGEGGVASEITAARVGERAAGTPIPLGYTTPRTNAGDRERRASAPRPGLERETRAVFGTGLLIAFLSGLVGVAAAIAIALYVTRVYTLRTTEAIDGAKLLISSMGIGMAIRWLSDPAGALLQTRGHIVTDNVLLALTEAVWLGGTVAYAHGYPQPGVWLWSLSIAFIGAGVFLLLTRGFAAHLVTGVSGGERLRFSPRIARPLLLTGSLITLAQLADYLYGPTDYILINRLLSAADLAAYAPAMQIDSGLLLLVAALASVLLPKAALDHAAGEREGVRRDYVRATLASAALLAVASAVVYLASPVILKLWLGRDLPATRRILPLVLLNTTIGGSAMVGRSILLATGRHAPFAVSVLLAGVTNVAASYAFVRYCHWGLAGIVAGTTVAVVARCLVWMPWYVGRSLRIPVASCRVASE